jgi:hypothetical protein
MEADKKSQDLEYLQALKIQGRNQYSHRDGLQISWLLSRILVEILFQLISPSGGQEYLYLQCAL